MPEKGVSWFVISCKKGGNGGEGGIVVRDFMQKRWKWRRGELRCANASIILLLNFS